MATTIHEIHDMLSKNEIKHQIQDEHAAMAFGTNVYVDKDGDNAIILIVDADEGGEFIQIRSIPLYENHQRAHDPAILKTCMNVNRKIKLVQCQYDTASGVLYIEVDITIEDSHLSMKQLLRAISTMIQTVDSFDAAFRSAVDDGKDISVQLVDAAFHSAVDDGKDFSAQLSGADGKRAWLLRLIEEASGAELDQLIQGLEFAVATADGSDTLH